MEPEEPAELEERIKKLTDTEGIGRAEAIARISQEEGSKDQSEESSKDQPSE